MSVTIRLSRIGRKNLPAYKIVVANTKDKRDGRSLDILGHYNPSENPAAFDIDKKKYEEWLSKGALVTNAVEKLVAGEYVYTPYTRQNEVDEKAEAAKAKEATEKANAEKAASEAKETDKPKEVETEATAEA